MEVEARLLYEVLKEVEVEQVGFVVGDPDFEYGCSPDGFVGEDGLIEIKCPTIAVHVEYLIKNELPSKYFHQVQGQLLVTGRKWCDFVSYYPVMKPLIIRVERDEAFISSLKIELELFCRELQETIQKLR
jgi:predicted phage-related endonuclease